MAWQLVGSLVAEREPQPIDVEGLAAKAAALVPKPDLDLQTMVAEMVAKALADLPTPRDGRDGQPGVPGAKGLDGINGVNGKDGADGLGFDDMSMEYDGDQDFTFRFVQGEREKSWTFTVPFMIYKEIWSPDVTYRKGMSVTWGGAIYTCVEASTTAKPGTPDEASRAWRLSVKPGRDGRDGKR